MSAFLVQLLLLHGSGVRVCFSCPFGAPAPRITCSPYHSTELKNTFETGLDDFVQFVLENGSIRIGIWFNLYRKLACPVQFVGEVGALHVQLLLLDAFGFSGWGL